MSNKLQTLVQHAKKTFLKQSDINSIDRGKFETLVVLANDLRMVDVNLPRRLCTPHGRVPDKVDYLSIHEDENVTIGVFVIEKDAIIPIHDHPGMHGLLKVLHGELEIITYSLANTIPLTNNNSAIHPSRRRFYYKVPIEAIKNQAIQVKPNDPCSQLTPSVNNIHLVKCTTGPAAFLDILSPPYEDSENPSAPRACHYFKELLDEPNKTKLVQISAAEAWP